MRVGPRNDQAMALLRLGVGVLFAIFGEYKLASPQFVHGGFRTWIERFLADGAYPFMVPLLRDFVLAHELLLGWLVALGESAVGVALLLGALVRPAAAGGLALMLALLFSSNYPGPDRPLWEYFGASLSHSVLALCFIAFLVGDSTRALSVWAWLRGLTRRGGPS